eukprot:9155750-Alexandrium_andersonii.AAC.1
MRWRGQPCRNFAPGLRQRARVEQRALGFGDLKLDATLAPLPLPLAKKPRATPPRLGTRPPSAAR